LRQKNGIDSLVLTSEFPREINLNNQNKTSKAGNLNNISKVAKTRHKLIIFLKNCPATTQ
jgi:hypothetical protein